MPTIENICHSQKHLLLCPISTDLESSWPAVRLPGSMILINFNNPHVSNGLELLELSCQDWIRTCASLPKSVIFATQLTQIGDWVARRRNDWKFLSSHVWQMDCMQHCVADKPQQKRFWSYLFCQKIKWDAIISGVRMWKSENDWYESTGAEHSLSKQSIQETEEKLQSCRLPLYCQSVRQRLSGPPFAGVRGGLVTNLSVLWGLWKWTDYLHDSFTDSRCLCAMTSRRTQ